MPQEVMYDRRFHRQRSRPQIAEMESALQVEQDGQLHADPDAAYDMELHPAGCGAPAIPGWSFRRFLWQCGFHGSILASR
jgi:hypothetical protein